MHTLIGAIKRTHVKRPHSAFIRHNIPCETFLNCISISLLSFLLYVEFYLHLRIYFSAKNYIALYQLRNEKIISMQHIQGEQTINQTGD